MKGMFFFVFLFVPTLLPGQKNALPLSVSIFNESTAIPYTRFFTTPMHPGFQVGTDFNYSLKRQSRLFQTANLSYFYHNYLAQGIGLNTEFGYEYMLKSGIAFAGLLGIGYMHTFATDEEFRLASGQYERKADKGNARLYPSLSFDFGYYFNKEVYSPKLFIRYQAWAEYPYSPGFIPVMTHINLHLGFRFMIKQKADTK